MDTLSTHLTERISSLIESQDVVLFMKGTHEHPMCGFSRQVVRILDHLKTPFLAVDIFQDEDLRHGLKIFSQWPTFPQLYIKGEFIGGCDIVEEMYKSQELHALLAS